MAKDKFKREVIIIGAGAAGFMAAIEAAKNGKDVLLVDHSSKIGEKIRISGGGRCNFTNFNAGPSNYLSENPHFCKSALSQYTAQDFISLVEDYKIDYHEKKLGQLFCNNSSKEIINMLFKEALKYRVAIQDNFQVKKLTRSKKPNLKKFYYEIYSNHGNYSCESLIIATGGLSIPPIGATDFAHKVAKQFEINVVEPRPALVPFLAPKPLTRFFAALSGVSIDAIVSTNGTSFRENILFTHKGLSGPAILQISSYWKDKDTVTLNLLPDINLQEELKKYTKDKNIAKKQLKTLLKDWLPDKFVDQWSSKHDLDKKIAEYSFEEIEKISINLQAWQIVPNGTEGYAKAEVTVGGIDTDELSSKTMEAKKSPGLFFIGEAVDVTGWLGGYNFQWAWSSGFVAGQNC